MSKKPDDAAKIAGLTSILKAGNQPKAAPPSPAPRPEPVITDAAPPARRPAKERVGKYRDPNFHQYGVYLRKETHKRVKRRLEDLETGQDLSELLQELLEQWLKGDQFTG